MYRLLIFLFKSNDYYFSKNEDDFIKHISNCGLSVVLDFESVIRLVYQHLASDSSWKIDVDFIMELGFLYTLSIANTRNNLLIAHYCDFNIMKLLPSYWTLDQTFNGFNRFHQVYVHKLLP